MGTTVTAAALVDDHLFLAQVGDSRGYILRGDTLVQVTRDQSLVNQLIEAGQLTEEEAETFEHNNIILQALGTSDTVQVDLTYVELRKGDILLLCSDGLSGMVRFDEIRELLKSSVEPLDICKGLTERANLAGGHDNITVIVVQFDGATLKQLEPAGEGEPLKYRKYTLGDESTHDTAPVAQGHAATPGPAEGHNADGSPRPFEPTRRPSSRPPGPWHEQSSMRSHEHDDRIDIPGTHVPIWMVIGIVLGVIVLLAGTAFLLLR
jgi:protein phosphatase